MKLDLIPIDNEIAGIVEGLFFRDRDNNIYAYAIELCRDSGYEDPRNKATREMDKDREFYNEYSCVGNLPTEAGMRKATLLMNNAIHVFMMGLDGKKAMKLKQDYAKIVESYRRGSFLNFDLRDPAQQRMILTEHMLQLMKSDMENKNSIKHLDKRVELITNEIISVTKSDRNELQKRRADLVEKIKVLCPNKSKGELFAILAKIVNEWFGVPKYGDIPRDKYFEAQNIYTCLHQLIAARKVNINEDFVINEVLGKIRLLFDSNKFPHYMETRQTTLDF